MENQETTQVQPENREEDLVTKVSKVEIKPQEKPDVTFNVNDINNIEDPKAKEYAEKAYKSFQGDYTRKSQALAEERKVWEAKKAEDEKWTQDKVQSLLKDQSFVQAAQSVATQQNTEEYSSLTDGEKKRIENAENIAKQMLQQNAQLLKHQQDESNKTKYANYDPKAVDILTADLISGKVQATRESIWKYHDYDSAVQRAYELGKTDKKTDNQEKYNSMSPEGNNVVGDDSIPKIEKGESDRAYLMRLGKRRLAQEAEGGQIRK